MLRLTINNIWTKAISGDLPDSLTFEDILNSWMKMSNQLIEISKNGFDIQQEDPAILLELAGVSKE